jgi:hypothetical protein
MRFATMWPLSGRPYVRCRADHAKRGPNVFGITMFRLILWQFAWADPTTERVWVVNIRERAGSGEIASETRPVAASVAKDTCQIRDERGIMFGIRRFQKNRF